MDLKRQKINSEMQRCRLQLRKYFFGHKVITSWNKLPEHVVDANSVNSFKKRLDDWLEDVDI